MVKDVLQALEYAEGYNGTRAVQAVPDEWKRLQPMNTPGGKQRLTTLSEQGLYFFLARSDKPRALPFQRWLAGEVLPAIHTAPIPTPPPPPTNNPIAVRTFSYGMLGDLHVIQDAKGEPWFVAADVCKCLGIGNPRSSLALLDTDEKGVHTVDTPGGVQGMATVSEAGLYSLILRSRKPEARDFKRWVTHEVLPAIRRHGGYLTPDNLKLRSVGIAGG